jgi:O-antigen/teichoic acid export membrane protein
VIRPTAWLGATSRAALTLMIGRTIGFAAAFGIPLVLVRSLDQEAFGTYKYLFMVANTLNVLQFGMAESLYYFVPRSPATAGRAMANALGMLSAIGVVVAVVMTTGATRLARWADAEAIAPYLPMLGVFLGLTLVALPLEIVMISRKQYRRAGATYAVSDVMRALALMAPAAIVHTLTAVLWGAIAFGACRVLAVAGYAAAEFRSRLRLDRQVWGAQIAYAAPFSMAVIIETAQLNLHQYVVWARFDPATFAVYAAGCLQIPLVDLLTTSVGNVMMVRMAEEAGLAGAGVRLWHQAVARLSFVLVPLVVALMLTAHDVIVLLFTPAYAGSVPIFRISTLAIGLAVLPVDSVLRVHARTRFLIGMNVIRLGVVAGGIGWALSTFQLTGAIGITVAAMAVAKGTAVWRIADALEVPVRRVLPWRPLARHVALAAAATLPFRWWLPHLTAWPPLAHGAIVAGSYAALYLGLDACLRIGRPLAAPASTLAR